MKIATHDGPFHTDEVMATALLLELFHDAKLTRTRDQSVLDRQDIVYDVGGEYSVEKRRFDHHMSDFDERQENGIVKSSLGLLWGVYGLEFCQGSEYCFEQIKERLVLPIDADDNGQKLFELNEFETKPVTLQTVIASFYPEFGSEASFDEGFEQAVELCRAFLSRLKRKYLAQEAGEQAFRKAVESRSTPEYVVLGGPLPYGGVIGDHPELTFIVFPVDGEEYMIRAVPSEHGSYDVRLRLPTDWAGLEGSALEQASGIDGLLFCHRNLWLAKAKDLESAIKAVEKALNT